jgi:regulator of protease activity HflC (stomatin/prohibitin superfamily)
MEKQMRAERDRRAAILNAEGIKQSQILTAEGEKQAAVLKAEGARTSAILKAEGEAKAIDTVFKAIHEGAPDQQLLSYQYLQMLPQLAQGSANKVWVIPSEFSQALGNIGSALTGFGGSGSGDAANGYQRTGSADRDLQEIDAKAAADAEAASRAAAEAAAEAAGASDPASGQARGLPAPPADEPGGGPGTAYRE